MFRDRRYQVLAILIILVIASGIIYLRRPDEKQEDLDLSAAIVDGLSQEFPNPGFVEEASHYLETGGYSVDYYNYSQVTVELYKGLPEKGYDLILLRIHSAPMDGDSPGAAFFTSESQQGLYFTEQLLGWVRRAKTLTRGDRYYAVTPGFLFEGMKGEFNGTVIVTMSCYGAVDDTLAHILIGRGAKAFIGWNEKITAQHMDDVTLSLLEQYIEKNKGLGESVDYVREEFGSDPFYDSELILYERT